MNRRWTGTLALIALGGVLIFLFRAKIAALNQNEITNLVYLTLWLVLIGGGVTASRSGLGPHWLRNAALWLVIILGIMGAYSMRDQFSAMLNPSAPRLVGEAIEVRRAEDGHFWADVDINGARLRMMIDTGASGIALTPADARLVGLDPAALRYTTPVSTAQGQTVAAPIMLDSVRLGAIEFERMPAAVMREDTDASLLGMSFLNRLDGYEVRSDSLLLHPPTR
jgi:aspartyl protease family protein